MDSNAYKYLTKEILNESSHISKELPALFAKQDISLNNETFDAVSLFLNQLIPEKPEVLSSEALPLPSILSQNEKDFFPLLFRTIHKNLAEILSTGDTPCDTSSFNRNGTEILRFLCHGVSLRWIPVFPAHDALSYAMSCFLIEACMHVGWCPNTFENMAKRAAHLYFSHLKKSLYLATDLNLTTILGYLQSMWACAQKTEGIQEKKLEWEHRDSIYRYAWKIETGTEILQKDFILYKTIRPSVHIVVPRYRNRIPHPFRDISQEGKTGLTIFIKNEPVRIVELIDTAQIDRPNCRGEWFTYSCKAGEEQQLTWTVVLQVFRNTVYRTDTLKPDSAACAVSHEKLYLENSIPLSPVTGDVYIGKGNENFILELLKNPFGLTYAGQEEEKSLFTGGEKILASNTSITMITGWSSGKDISTIDRTNLLGIFDMPEIQE